MNSFKVCFVASAVVLGISLLVGCKKEYFSTTNNPTTNTTQSSTSSTDPGVVVNNNITAIITYNDVLKMNTGDTMKIRLNHNNYEVREYTAIFQSATTDAGEQLIYCSIPGVVIGAGDSGSPLFTKDGRVAGALCYGFDGDNHQFAARPIEDLLSISSLTKAGKVNSNLSQYGMHTLAPAYKSRGLTTDLINRYASRDVYNILSRYASSTTATNSATQTSLKSYIPVSELIAGMSAGVVEGTGDLVLLGAIGTISYIDNSGNMFAYGHPYADTYLPIAAPIYVADTKLFVESYSSSYKSADISSFLLGIMKVDNYYGVLFNQSKQPQVFTSKVSLSYYGSTDSLVYNDTLANNYNINYEYQLAAYMPSIGEYYNRATLQGKYVNVSGKVITKTTDGKTTVLPISFNTLTSTVDLDMNDVLNDKFSSYTSHILSQQVSLGLTAATHADSVLVPIAYH